RKDEAMAHWRASIAELAKCPNVYVKLGGLGMPYLGLGLEKLEKPASSERLAGAGRPHLQHFIEKIGARRRQCESNFPPDRESCGYVTLWNACKRIAARYSADEKRALFLGAAAKAYRLNLG